MRGDSFFGTGTAYNVGASHIREKLGDFVRTTLGDGGSSIGTVFLESSGTSAFERRDGARVVDVDDALRAVRGAHAKSHLGA